MKPRDTEKEELQLEFGDVVLETFINMKDEFVILGKAIDWKHFNKKFGESFHESQGRPGLPTRLMVGLTYLKYLHNLSDEKVIKQFLRDPYWQYFCGCVCFQKKVPLEASSLTRFRKRLGEEGAEELLKQTLEVAKKAGLLKRRDLKKVIVDTTTQEKNISYPTDAKLINKAREGLVRESRKEGISLRQNYKFKAKKESLKSGRYFHAKQYKRGRASLRKQRNWLGRVIRDVERKSKDTGEKSEKLKSFLELGWRIFHQEKKSKGKLYSLHEPHVECLSKGKAHKRYEFGNKVSFSVSSRGNWITGARSFFGNPFDGKTLKEGISQVERLTGERVERIGADRGYRGKQYHPEGKETLIAGMKIKDRGIRKFLRRRPSIEPVIGHMKEEYRLGRNYLGGIEGDKMNPILSASAFNLQKLLRSFVVPFLYWLKKQIFFGFLPS